MYKCLKCDFDSHLEKRINQIIRKLNKRGIPYTYERLDDTIELVDVVDYRNPYNIPANQFKPKYLGKRAVEVVNYNFDMEALKIGEYTPVAVLDHTLSKTENLVHLLVDGLELPGHYRHAKSNCDHCKSKRFRNKTVVLMNSAGEYVQVGTTCIKDFTGIDAAGVLSIYTELRDILLFDCTVDFSRMSCIPDMRKTSEYLACCIELIDTEGYNNGVNYDETTKGRGWSNSNTLLPINPQYLEKATEVIEFFNSADLSGDFMLNTKLLLSQEYTKSPSGFIAYAYLAYKKEIDKIIKKAQSEEENSKSNWVGSIASRIGLELTIDKYFSFETMFGVKRLYLFKDINGNVFKWSTQSNLQKGIGERVTLKGTISGHEIYNNIKQTVLTRCKVIEEKPEQGQQLELNDFAF